MPYEITVFYFLHSYYFLKIKGKPGQLLISEKNSDYRPVLIYSLFNWQTCYNATFRHTTGNGQPGAVDKKLKTLVGQRAGLPTFMETLFYEDID